jgi:hypothetical protein
MPSPQEFPSLETDAMWGCLGFLDGIAQGFYERPIVFLLFCGLVV